MRQAQGAAACRRYPRSAKCSGRGVATEDDGGAVPGKNGALGEGVFEAARGGRDSESGEIACPAGTVEGVDDLDELVLNAADEPVTIRVSAGVAPGKAKNSLMTSSPGLGTGTGSRIDTGGVVGAGAGVTAAGLRFLHFFFLPFFLHFFFAAAAAGPAPAGEEAAVTAAAGTATSSARTAQPNSFKLKSLPITCLARD